MVLVGNEKKQMRFGLPLLILILVALDTRLPCPIVIAKESVSMAMVDINDSTCNC